MPDENPQILRLSTDHFFSNTWTRQMVIDGNSALSLQGVYGYDTYTVGKDLLLIAVTRHVLVNCGDTDLF